MMHPVAQVASRKIALNLGRIASRVGIRGVPRVLYSLRKVLRGCDPFELPSGAKMSLDLDDYFESMMLWERYQSEILALLGRFLFSGARAIDGGAHIGYFSLRMAQIVGPTGHIYAFEPDPRAHARLVNVLKLNAVDDRVTPLPCALAESNRRLPFFLSPQFGWSTAVPNTHLTGLTQITVDAVSVDSLIERGAIPPDISFVKLDLEGFEAEALLGMHRLLSSGRAIVLFEINRAILQAKASSPQQIASILRSRGFALYVVKPGRRLYGLPRIRLVRFEETCGDCDVLAVPANRISVVSDLVVN